MKIPKVESLIITVFFLSIALWAISKCASKRGELPRSGRETTEEPEPLPSAPPATAPAPGGTAASPAAGVPQLQNPPPATTAAAPAPATHSTGGGIPKLSNEPATPPPAAEPAPVASTAPNLSKLFVTINGLKVRKAPNLKSEVVARLQLDEQVYFLNKKSEKPEEINLGYEKATDYWVKIRTKSGKEGWVFGAGVHYYKMKRKGVME